MKDEYGRDIPDEMIQNNGLVNTREMPLQAIMDELGPGKYAEASARYMIPNRLVTAEGEVIITGRNLRPRYAVR